MPSAQEIYRDSISRLPTEERLKLAALILKDLAAAKGRAEEKLSVIDLIKSLPAGRGFKTSAETDEYLRGERDSWDH